MKILVINSDYLPFELKKLAQWFADHSMFLLIPSIIAPRLRKELTGIFTHIFDYSNSDQLFLVADEAHREKYFDCVIGHVEPDLLPAAQLRRLWGMKGASYESILAYRDKAVMKRTLQARGIAVPKFAIVESGADLIGFIKQNGYPVLTKPRSARRALGIQVLHNDWELKCLLDRGIRATSDSFPNMMVEEFVEANMYHVDGLVVNGQVKFIWPSEYITKCDGFGEGKHIASISLASDNVLAENLIHYVKTVIDALPSPENFAFHAEVFKTSTGKLKLCEIAARPGAGPVVAAFDQIFHIDIKRLAMLSSIMGIDNPLQMPVCSHPDGLCGWLIFPNQFLNCSLKRVPQNCPIPNVCSYRTFAQEGDKFSNERVVLAEIIVTADNEENAKDAITATVAWFYNNVEYG